MPIALSWVCTATILAGSSLQAAIVHSIVHFLQLYQKYRSFQNQPQYSCNLSSQQQPKAKGCVGNSEDLKLPAVSTAFTCQTQASNKTRLESSVLSFQMFPVSCQPLCISQSLSLQRLSQSKICISHEHDAQLYFASCLWFLKSLLPQEIATRTAILGNNSLEAKEKFVRECLIFYLSHIIHLQ